MNIFTWPHFQLLTFQDEINVFSRQSHTQGVFLTVHSRFISLLKNYYCHANQI